MITFLNLIMGLLSVFLILVILVQKGRGGGLAGALGGVGGSSAFGTRAGDVFTKITVVIFLAWLLLGMIMVRAMQDTERYQVEARKDSITADDAAKKSEPKDAKSPKDSKGAPLPAEKLPDEKKDKTSPADKASVPKSATTPEPAKAANAKTAVKEVPDSKAPVAKKPAGKETPTK